ncbi:MAG: hemerythrin [Candidatus Aminicenantes bacterium RBG_16_63_16]|nr:MAG: hemerythrin [Candidatus Aminicenantes bacterium RBG_16_63_16]
MKPTETLKTEHKAILLMLEVTESVGRKLESGENIPAEHLTKIVDFIRGFADKCHHAKEEDLLFPAMEKTGIPRQGGPIGVMLAEHTQGREYVRMMKEAAEKYAAGDKKAGLQFAENARHYAALLSQHIHKEDNILYPIADARLSPQAQSSLEKDFERVEEEVVGAGQHEEYHRLLEKLEKIYC